jgi:hypothetical protein
MSFSEITSYNFGSTKNKKAGLPANVIKLRRSAKNQEKEQGIEKIARSFFVQK